MPFCLLVKLLAWSSLLCGPVHGHQVTGDMRGWSDLTISPGLVSYLFDGSWCLELPGVGCEGHAVNSSAWLLAQQPQKLVGWVWGQGADPPLHSPKGKGVEEGIFWCFWCVSRGGESTGGAAPVSTSTVSRRSALSQLGRPSGTEGASKAGSNSLRGKSAPSGEQGQPG